MRIMRASAMWAAAIIICSSPPVRAQAARSASVSGIVRDPSEAVVAGATVEIRNRATNQEWQASTDARGRFRVLYLPVGDYRLSIASAGFSTATASLTLGVGDE